jgi:hypothetical protein
VSKKPTKPARAAIPAKAKAKGTAGLLGLALDHDDGHKRMTTGEQFMLVGGSEETHSRMTETVVKTFEELKRRHKRLETVEPKELAEILQKSVPQ